MLHQLADGHLHFRVHIELGRTVTIADTPKSIVNRSINDRPKRLIKIHISNDRIRKVDAILRNATERGAGIELQTKLEQGEKVLISIKNLEPFLGTVAWSKNLQAGLEFDELIDPSLLKVKNSNQISGEGIFNSVDGYHVFDRFKPVSEVKRPAVKLRK